MKNKPITIILLLTLFILSAFPKNVALLVGLNNYLYLPDLKYAEKDAEDLEAVLKIAGFDTFLLTGQTISGEAILEQINFIAKYSSYSDIFLFFFSGHGIGGSTETEKGMLTAFSDPERRNAMVSHADLKDSISKFKGKKIVVVDACNQGYETKSQWVRTQGLKNAVDFLLFSSASNQESHDGFREGNIQIDNGIAAYYLKKAIEGYADFNTDNSLSAGELEEYLTKNAQFYATKFGQYMEVYNNRSNSEKLINLGEPAQQGTQKGTLIVESIPSGAEIWIGGKQYGQTNKNFTADPGTYEVELRKSGYETYRENVTVTSGSTSRVDQRLEEEQTITSLYTPGRDVPEQVPTVQNNEGTGYLLIEGNTGRNFFIDGENKGWIIPKEIKLIVGNHTVEIEGKGQVEVEIKESETTKIDSRTEFIKIFQYIEQNEDKSQKSINTPKLILVNGGSFQMGNTRDDSDGYDYEEPIHTVRLSYDYYIGKTEVSFKEYDAFCEATGKSKPKDAGWGRVNRPVINVSWNDAVDYCNWLSDIEGLAKAYDSNGNLLDKYGKKTTDITQVEGYRLPTEAEWEYAARGGHESKTDFKFAGSNSVEAVAWYMRNSNSKTQEIGQMQPNELGLYDMSGNVWEWCHDYWEKYFYKKTLTENPVNLSSSSSRILRSGGWRYDSRFCRIAYRDHDVPDQRNNNIGFRIAKLK